jgi:hypothetical protein
MQETDRKVGSVPKNSGRLVILNGEEHTSSFSVNT